MTPTTPEPPRPGERQEEVQEPIHLPIPEPHEDILPDGPPRQQPNRIHRPGIDENAVNRYHDMIQELQNRLHIQEDENVPSGRHYGLRNRANLHPDQFIVDNYEIYMAERVLPDLPEPETMEEARERPDWNEWLAAMLLELESLRNLSTYTFVKRKPLMNILRNKWVFSYKLDTAG